MFVTAVCKLGVIPKDTHPANNARTHAYDLLGFYHKEKCSMLVHDLSPDIQLTLTPNNLRIRSAKNIDFVEKRKVPQVA